MKIRSVKHNIIANFAGRAWTSIMSLVFLPIYIKFMGIEAYGLVGIFASILALLSILDLGLSATLSRELARLSISEDTAQESKDLVRTLEVVYWSVGLLVGLGLIFLAPVITNHWITSQGISSKTIQRAVVIMGLIVAFQWPASLYDGGLLGLQQQVLLNGLRSVMATIQHGGAVLVLWLISPSIISYFIWQIFISMIQTFLLGYSVWKALPRTLMKSTFRKSLMQKHWKFAAGMMSISIVVTILTQADKVILSKLLTLTLFGYYTLAFNIANSISLLVNPAFAALFPKFSQLTAEKDNGKILSEYYHKGCQVVSVIVLPAAIILALFSQQILRIWVHDPIIAQKTHLLLSLLTIGSTLNALMTLPYAMQLANGWTKLSFLKNVIAIVLLVPLMIWLTSLYGAIGAAIVWILLNMGYFLIEIPIMHHRLLKQEMWSWYFDDIGIPLITILFIVVCSRFLMPRIDSLVFSFLWILCSGLLALLSSSLSVPTTREWLKRSFAL